MVRIRAFEDRDADAARALFLAGAEALPPDVRQATRSYYAEALESDLADIRGRYTARPDSGFWVAEDGVEIVGTVAITRRSRGEAELCRLVVAATRRGEGIGRRLVETAERSARRRGYRRIVLHTLEAQTHAARLYERAGYREVATTFYGAARVRRLAKELARGDGV